MTDKRLDQGAASVNIDLSNGIITVKHGSCGTTLLKGEAVDGSWDKLFALLEDDINLTRVAS